MFDILIENNIEDIKDYLFMHIDQKVVYNSECFFKIFDEFKNLYA